MNVMGLQRNFVEIQEGISKIDILDRENEIKCPMVMIFGIDDDASQFGLEEALDMKAKSNKNRAVHAIGKFGRFSYIDQTKEVTDKIVEFAHKWDTDVEWIAKFTELILPQMDNGEGPKNAAENNVKTEVKVKIK